MTEPDPTNPNGVPTRADLMMAAATDVLRPLVEMLLANGARYGAVAELLKGLMVEAARARVPGAASERGVSRISAATGIHRREVKRLLTTPSRVAELGGRSLAAEVFTGWLTDRRFVDEAGAPRVLARSSDDPAAVSFETLARSVSRDVHPRTILEELARLKMVEIDDLGGVRLVTEAFVPAGEEREVLRFLADNVSDHLAAAVANVEGREDRFLEQSVFADELSAESARAIEGLARRHWQLLLREMAPRMQALLDEDRSAGRAGDTRARVGMYSYAAPMRPRTKK